jgi:hypothetical protein
MIELRPSAASRWIACPASARLSKDIPPTPSGDAAQAGTAIHALAQDCYLFGDDPMESIGVTLEGVKLAEWHCQMAADHLQCIKDIEDFVGPINLKIEHKVSYLESEKVRLRGTADVIGASKDKGVLIIADLKTGAQYVDEDSDQLKVYALAAMRSMNLKQIDTIELHINQPRTGGVRVHVMKIDALMAWENNVLIPAITEAIDPNCQPRPSEKACQWCPAKLTCPAQKESFEIIEAQPNVTAMTKEDIKAVMVRLSDQQVSDLLDRAPVVESFIDALRKHALERMKDGGTLPGWQLAPKRAARKWKDEKKAKVALLEAGINEDQLYSTEFISPAVVEKLLPREQREILEELTVKESSGITIARDASLRQ